MSEEKYGMSPMQAMSAPQQLNGVEISEDSVPPSEEMALISRAEWDKFQFCYKTLLAIKMARDSNHPEWYKLVDWSVLDK